MKDDVIDKLRKAVAEQPDVTGPTINWEAEARKTRRTPTRVLVKHRKAMKVKFQNKINQHQKNFFDIKPEIQ